MVELIATVAIFCVIVGCAVVYLNPERATNVVFAMTSAFVGVWLTSIALIVIRAGRLVAPDSILVFYLRVNALIGAYFPWAVWMLKESLMVSSIKATWERAKVWFWVCTCLSLLTFSDSFIYYSGEPPATVRGAAYIIYTVIGVALYLVLMASTVRQMREQTGVRLMETRFLVLTLCIACLTIVLCTSIGNIFQVSVLKKLSIVVFMLSYLATAWGIYLYKIYDSNALLIALGQRIFITIVAGAEMLWACWFLTERVGVWSAIAAGVVLWSFTIFWFDARTRELLDLDGRKETENARRMIIQATQEDSGGNSLGTIYGAIIAKMFIADGVRLEIANEGSVKSSMIGMDEPTFRELLDLGWATPESLSRRRWTPSRRELFSSLERMNAGVAVVVSSYKQRASLVILLGRKASRWPYTYAEIQRLRTIAELIDNIMAHARLVEQASTRDRFEHMELLARGLAHDVKNLLTPISAFVFNCRGRFEAGSREREAHEAAEQSILTMSEYLKEVHALSAPIKDTCGRIKIRGLVESVIQVNSVVAVRRSIQLACDIGEELEVQGDAVLLNRLISNLVVNALEAVSDGGNVRIAGSVYMEHCIRIVVEDDGCGISPELKEKVFAPYFSTKQGGERAFGTGIGLTICQRIVQLHNGTLDIESKVRSGTRVIVVIPQGRRDSSIERFERVIKG